MRHAEVVSALSLARDLATTAEGPTIDDIAERLGSVLADPPYSSGGNVRDKAMATSRKYLQSGQQVRYPEFQRDTRDQRSFLAWSTSWMGAPATWPRLVA